MKKILVLTFVGIYLFGLFTSSPVLSVKSAMAKEIISSPVSSPVSYNIAGSIKIISTPLSGIKVQLLSTGKKQKLIKETYSDNMGNYSLSDVSKGDYVVSVVDLRYKFSPVRYFISIVSSSVDNLDFQAKIK